MNNKVSTWNNYKKNLFQLARTRRKLITASFEITPLCNFNCKMCYVHLSANHQKKKQELVSPEQWIILAKKCKEAGALFLTLTGGEVFTYPQFVQLYETLYDMGFLINIMSNGYLIDDTVIETFKKRKPNKVRITIYGNTDGTYEKVCGIKCDSNRVKNNILLLKDNGIPTSVSMTIIKDNESEYADILEWTKEHQLPFLSTYRIRKQMRGDVGDVTTVRIDPEDNIDYIDESSFLSDMPINDSDYFKYCRLYNCGITVTWDGKMIGCNSLDNISVPAFSGDVNDNFMLLWEKLSSINMPDKCRRCKIIEFCSICPGKIAGESGNPEIVSDYVCSVAYNQYIQYINNRRGIKE